MQAKLPKAKAGGQPLPEGLLWLLFTGKVKKTLFHGRGRGVRRAFNMGQNFDRPGGGLSLAAARLPPPSPLQLPTDAQVKSVTEELRARSAVPGYVKTVLEALPSGTHPMTQFSTLVLALQVRHWGGGQSLLYQWGWSHWCTPGRQSLM